jgi:hypothetical protein
MVQELSVVSPYIDVFNLFPKAKRVNKCPGLDLQAGFNRGDDLTEVNLSDAPKLLYASMPRKKPIAYPTDNYLSKGDGTVPLYASQIQDTPFKNPNNFYASQFSYTPLKSGFDSYVSQYFDKLQVQDFNRHRLPSKEIGEYSLNDTTQDKLERLIRGL